MSKQNLFDVYYDPTWVGLGELDYDPEDIGQEGDEVEYSERELEAERYDRAWQEWLAGDQTKPFEFN